jgi:lysophospholipase L1-like esterase
MRMRRDFSILMMIGLVALGAASASDVPGIPKVNVPANAGPSVAANAGLSSAGSMVDSLVPAANPYLGLGDSVPFGFINQAGFEYYNPENFVGYPDWTGIVLGLSTANAACPGETTGSFLSSNAPDLGCRLYRSVTHLHVDYGSASTQMQYAINFLQEHGDTALVTVQVGSNDVGLLEIACNYDPTCIAKGIGQVYAQVATNMATILGNLRGTGYRGAIVIVNYYSTDYSDSDVTAIIYGLDQAMAAPAPIYGAAVADVFTAFQAASAPAGGKTCVAGLLNPKNNPQTPLQCDGHPSQSGHKLITKTILQLAPGK